MDEMTFKGDTRSRAGGKKRGALEVHGALARGRLPEWGRDRGARGCCYPQGTPRGKVTFSILTL